MKKEAGATTLVTGGTGFLGAHLVRALAGRGRVRVLVHSAPPEWLKTWAHAEVEAGADIVVMHGAPLVHGVEIYRGRPIFYDLGNFIFQLPPTTTMLDEPIVWESVVAHVDMQGKAVKSIHYLGDKIWTLEP